jgi:uncharacterized PurR-regulated membrane protein YhhQ (DUF165 family)
MTFKTKESRLLLVLGSFFVANAILSEFIGVKIFTVEGTLGIKQFDINLLGVPNLSFNMSAGVLTWPLIFIMTDIINEYFGVRQVRFLSILTAVLIAYAFFIVGASHATDTLRFLDKPEHSGASAEYECRFCGNIRTGNVDYCGLYYCLPDRTDRRCADLS